MRLIDADALMKTLGITDMDCEKCEWGDYNHCIRGGDFEDACSAIEDAPTIEERKKGEWIREDIVLTSIPPQYQWHCSECGYFARGFSPTKLTNYCPSCGAKMEGNT